MSHCWLNSVRERCRNNCVPRLRALALRSTASYLPNSDLYCPPLRTKSKKANYLSSADIIPSDIARPPPVGAPLRAAALSLRGGSWRSLGACRLKPVTHKRHEIACKRRAFASVRIETWYAMWSAHQARLPSPAPLAPIPPTPGAMMSAAARRERRCRNRRLRGWRSNVPLRCSTKC
jgi:hypothetical protein